MGSTRLSRRCALVSGALRGIGRASAECRAADEAEVVLTDLDPEASDEVSSVPFTMPDSVYVRLDATSGDVWQRVRRCRAPIRPPRHSHEQRRQRPDRRAESPVTSRRAVSAGQSMGHAWRLEPEEHPQVGAKVGAIAFPHPIAAYHARMPCRLRRGDT